MGRAGCIDVAGHGGLNQNEYFVGESTCSRAMENMVLRRSRREEASHPCHRLRFAERQAKDPQFEKQKCCVARG